jgi:hypothetical protein
VTDQWPAGGTERHYEASAGIDTSKAHQARIYDYWLGGKDNFAIDREAAEQALAAYPGLRRGVRAQRAFLARAVEYLAGPQGIRQFLDIGTGIPPRTTLMRWRSPSRRRHALSTWTTIPWCWRTPARC